MDARTLGAVLISSLLSSALSALGVGIAFSANDSREQHPASPCPPTDPLSATDMAAGTAQTAVKAASAIKPADSHSVPGDTALGNVTVHSLSLVDDKGNTRCTINTEQGRTRLRMLDAQGDEQVTLACCEDGAAAIYLCDAEGRLRFSVSDSGAGSCYLMLHAGAESEGTLSLSMDDSGRSSISMNAGQMSNGTPQGIRLDNSSESTSLSINNENTSSLSCNATPYSGFSVMANAAGGQRFLSLDAQCAQVHSDKQGADGAGLHLTAAPGFADLALSSQQRDWQSQSVTASSTAGLTCSLYSSEVACRTLGSTGPLADCVARLSASERPELSLRGSGLTELLFAPVEASNTSTDAAGTALQPEGSEGSMESQAK